MKTPLLCALLLVPILARAQSVGIGTTIPNSKAALDISATGKGLLIPRMDSATRVAIGTPPDGLMVFQTDGRKGFWYAMSNAWLYIPDKTRSGDNLGNHTATQPIGFSTNDTDKVYFTQGGGANGSKLAHGAGWSLDYYAGPNNGAVGTHRFLTGTTTGWAERLRINYDGRVGIGTAAPAAPLDVQAGTALTGATTGTATQLRLTRPGTSGTKWNSSAELAVGTYATGVNAQSQLDFKLGQNGNATADQTVLTLRGNGNVGIGTATPARKLDVNGSIRQTTYFNPLNLGAGVRGHFTWTHNLGYQPTLMFSVDDTGAGGAGMFINISYEHVDNNRVNIWVRNNGAQASFIVRWIRVD